MQTTWIAHHGTSSARLCGVAIQSPSKLCCFHVASTYTATRIASCSNSTSACRGDRSVATERMPRRSAASAPGARRPEVLVAVLMRLRRWRGARC
jgi:hypothetical protein